jgi:molybdopterin-guanine dinucleotide biosynthesis protein A
LDSSGNVTGIVLCGGGGKRFQGADKPLMRLNGRPMLEHVLERLAPQVADIILSANRNLDDYARYGHPVVPDQASDRGPLAGLVSTLPITDSELLFLCPGDAPLLASDLVERLREHLNAEVDAVVPHDGKRAQHLFMLLRREAADAAADYLERGGRSVAGFLDSLDVFFLPIDDGNSFANVNTTADLEAVAHRLKRDWRSKAE